MEDIKRMGETHAKGTLDNCDLVLYLEKKVVDMKSTLAELNNEYNKLNLIFELKGYSFQLQSLYL